MDQEVIDQTRRKARYCVNRLQDLERSYYSVCERRSAKRNRKRASKPKARTVIAPVTVFTSRSTFYILMGDFDTAFRLVADLKVIQNLMHPLNVVVPEFYNPKGSVYEY